MQLVCSLRAHSNAVTSVAFARCFVGNDNDSTITSSPNRLLTASTDDQCIAVSIHFVLIFMSH